jgi:hypothetical protein
MVYQSYCLIKIKYEADSFITFIDQQKIYRYLKRLLQKKWLSYLVNIQGVNDFSCIDRNHIIDILTIDYYIN